MIFKYQAIFFDRIKNKLMKTRLHFFIFNIPFMNTIII